MNVLEISSLFYVNVPVVNFVEKVCIFVGYSIEANSSRMIYSRRNLIQSLLIFHLLMDSCCGVSPNSIHIVVTFRTDEEWRGRVAAIRSIPNWK